MKIYEVRYCKEKPILTNGVSNSTQQSANGKVIEANNVRDVFAKLKKEFEYVDVFSITERMPNGKDIDRFNKFYFLDKKNGSLRGPKLIYDITKGGYINKYHSTMELFVKGEFQKAAHLIYNITFRKHVIIKVQNEFRHYKSIIEKYCIKNNLTGIAGKLNSARISPQVQLMRDKVSFNIKLHLEKQDISGKTKGCGCPYCKALYFKQKAHDEAKAAYDFANLHRSYHFGDRRTFVSQKGEYFLKLIPTMASASRRLTKKYAKLHNQWKKFEVQERNWRIWLQIPKTS
jgi:hypothetical protein